MEKLLSNEEFNNLLKSVKVEKQDFNMFLLEDKKGGVDEALAKLKVYWKIAKPVLKAVKLVTPRKIDKGIDEFIAIVDQLTGEATEEEISVLLEKFAIVWGIVKPILEAAKEFTPPKSDAIIDEVIKIGDLLAKS